jgi:hypothetical protein
MKLLLATFLAMFLFTPSNALPQISCFGYGGGMTSCSGPHSNMLITPLSPSQGIIQGDRDGHSYMEPYCRNIHSLRGTHLIHHQRMGRFVDSGYCPKTWPR